MSVVSDLQAERAKVRSLVTTLEGIAHFGIGTAGVVARDALVELGVWSDTVERAPAPPSVALCLETLAASGVGLRHAVHDPPMFEHMGPVLIDGTWVFVVPEERCPNPFCDGYGNIDVSTNCSGRSRTYATCEVGPHR